MYHTFFACPSLYVTCPCPFYTTVWVNVSHFLHVQVCISHVQDHFRVRYEWLFHTVRISKSVCHMSISIFRLQYEWIYHTVRMSKSVYSHVQDHFRVGYEWIYHTVRMSKSVCHMYMSIFRLQYEWIHHTVRKSKSIFHMNNSVLEWGMTDYISLPQVHVRISHVQLRIRVRYEWLYHTLSLYIRRLYTHFTIQKDSTSKSRTNKWVILEKSLLVHIADG